MRDFLESLEDEELICSGYELSQPMPKKIFSDTEKTLAEEGLHPKAVIQVGLI